MHTVVKRNEAARLIQGVILKCVDGRWTDADGLTPPAQLLALGTTRALQCWREQKVLDTVIETPGEPLPDAAHLNKQIPQNEWEAGLDGKPRAPWQLNWVVYLLNVNTADTYTFLNSTTGARIAVERLADQFKWMRTMRGSNVMPIVKLDSRPMKTSFGTKMRPEFSIVEWRELDAPTTQPAVAQTAPQIENKMTLRPTQTAAKTPAKTPAKPSVGKPVKPVSPEEDMDDVIPF
jgi:hypothetical protein